jgi:hypothetical protein
MEITRMHAEQQNYMLKMKLWCGVFPNQSHETASPDQYLHGITLTIQDASSWLNYYTMLLTLASLGSSVSMGSDYGLHDWAIKVRSLAEAKDISSSLCVQTSSAAHPAYCPLDTRGPSPGLKCGRGMTLTTHPHLVPRSRMSRSYTPFPPKRLHGM